MNTASQETGWAWRLHAFGQAFRKDEVVLPEPQGRQLLVRVSHCGVCHSDLHFKQGHYDLGGGRKTYIADRGLKLPLALGHEIVGTVVKAGSDATQELVGRRRLVYPWLGCGHCEHCSCGNDSLCVTSKGIGIFVDGGYAQHVLVPDEKFLLDVGGLDPATAATYACSGLTVYSAVKKIQPLPAGARVAVIGCGGLGQLALQVLRALELGPVAAVEPDPGKRNAALEAGAEIAIDPNAADAAAQLTAFSGGRLTAVLDFVGAESTSALALGAMSKGGKLVLIGLFGGELKYPLPMFPLRMLTVMGSYVGSLEEMREFLELVQRIRPPAVAIDRRPMDEVNQALDDLAHGRVAGRVVLQV